MSRRHLRRKGPGPLELIEEAVHLLRVVPWAVLGSYYVGSLPFVLGVLTAWLFFYFVGRSLLAIPDSFHEGTIWKSKFMDEP